MSAAEPESKSRLLRIVTVWSTIEEFLAGFCRIVDETSVVVVTARPLTVGEKRMMTIVLKNGKPAMQSWVEVVATAPISGAAADRRAVRLKLIEPDAAAQAVHKQLLERAKAKAEEAAWEAAAAPPKKEAPAAPPKKEAPAAPPKEEAPAAPPKLEAVPKRPSELPRTTPPRRATIRTTLPMGVPVLGARRAPVPPWLSRTVPPASAPTVTPQSAPDSTAPAAASGAPVGPLVAAIQAAAETSAAAAETSAAAAETTAAAAETTAAVVETSAATAETTAAAVETSAAVAETSAAPIESSSPAFASTEIRAPSAADMLPANPFADLPPMALEHFIDCTMYEETGPLPIDMEPTTALADLGLVPPVIVSPPEEPKRTAPAERPADPAFGVLQPVKPPPSHAWSIAVAVVLGLAGALAGYLLRGLQTPTELVIVRPMEAGPPPTSPTIVNHAEPAPAVVAEPASAAPKVEQPAPAPTAAVPSSCEASITSKPKGAQVSWAGKPVGVTPLEHTAVPCGKAVVVLRHPEFLRVEREVDAEPSAPATVAVHLVHPPGRLDLSSTPAGATFVVSGSTVGKAPTSADVTTFTQVEVSATLPGFKPWKQKVFVNERRMSVRAQLEPLKQP